MEQAKQATDAVAYGVTLGTVVGVIPSLAGLFTIVWLAIRIYESDSGQRIVRWFGRRMDAIRAWIS